MKVSLETMVLLTIQPQIMPKYAQASGELQSTVGSILRLGYQFHNQHQSYSEDEGGNLKFRILKLFHNTPHALLQYWCFGAEYFDQIGCYLSKASLDGRCSSEKLRGQIVDISVFKFYLFQHV